MATLLAVFLVALAEMGDKTQLLALGLGAHFESVLPVVLGSVAGVFLVNAPSLLVNGVGSAVPV